MKDQYLFYLNQFKFERRIYNLKVSILPRKLNYNDCNI